MTLLTPIWLLLIIPLGVALWIWPLPSRILNALRIVVLTLLVAAMAGLALKLPSRTGTVVVVADRSRSMPVEVTSQHREAIDLLHDGKRADDRLAVIGFGETAAVEQPAATEKFKGFNHDVGLDASNLHDAIERAVSLIPPDTPGRVVVLSDGRWTGKDPSSAAARAAARGIAVDYRTVQRPTTGDVAIASLDVPPTVSPHEAFMITAWVQSPTAQDVNYTLKRGAKILASGKRPVPAGLSRLTFRDSVDEPTTAAYTLTVDRADDTSLDPLPQNNAARMLVGVTGPKPVMLLTRKPDLAFANLLKRGGLDVQVRRPHEMNWTLDELSGYSAAVIEDVPASEIGETAMSNIVAWVRETGAGMMMTGGQTSFGPGGYHKSVLDPILPVSMELRREHRKHSLAIVIAMDRSGSMTMPVPGGRTKMDLANMASVRVLDTLTDMDELGVIAIDSTAHTMAPLTRLDDAGKRARMRSDILRIESMGGGIFVYEALDAAVRMLAKSQAGARHIILFSDAADSEEPGKYKELLKHATAAGITCSVIGLGTKADSDARLLEDVAKSGGGRIFFTEDAKALPLLFAQDVFIVARSTFVDEETAINTTPHLTALSGKAYAKTPPHVGGYNLTYLRPGADLDVVTTDEYTAPVTASWQAGVGRVLAYTGQADGKFTGPIAKWDQVGDFMTGLVRWTAGEGRALPDGMMLTQEVREGIAYVQLHLDPDRTVKDVASLPEVTVLRGQPGSTPQIARTKLDWVSPDTLGLELPLTGTDTVLATVQVAGQPPIALPPVTLAYSPEFKPQGADRGEATLKRLAKATGGSERIDLASVWADLPNLPRFIDLSPWLLLAAVVMFLVEVLERRTGVLSTGNFKLQRDRVEGTVVKPAKAKAVKAQPGKAKPTGIPEPAASTSPSTPAGAPAASTPPPPPTAKPKPADDQQGSMLDALGAARKRASRRTDRNK
ncbi:MAG: VWA domain-containing protein [Phycisphaera sp.]|nr:VWA domain-containing protein [Phycisphaera sp.]